MKIEFLSMQRFHSMVIDNSYDRALSNDDRLLFVL